MSIELAAASVRALEAVWRYAGEIITHEDVWHAIELVAEELQDGRSMADRSPGSVVRAARLKHQSKPLVTRSKVRTRALIGRSALRQSLRILVTPSSRLYLPFKLRR